MSDILNRLADPFSRATAPTTSLLDLKIEKLRGRLQEKSEKFSPVVDEEAAAASDYRNIENVKARFAAGRNSGSLAGGEEDTFNNINDLYSLANSGVRTSVEDVQNFATGQVNPNRIAESDEAAGVRPGVRQAFDAKTTEAINTFGSMRNQVQDGNYPEAASEFFSGMGQTAEMLPELVATSLVPSVVEGVAGALAIPGYGGAVSLGKRAVGVKNVLKQIGAAGDAARAAKKAKKAADAVKKTSTMTKYDKIKGGLKSYGKNVAQASVMTASYSQKLAEDYYAENGTQASASFMAVNTLIGAATQGIDVGIFKNVVLGNKSNKTYVKAMKDMLDDIPKAFSKKVALRVLNKGKELAKAGSMEAGQEYIQSWHEILAVKMDEATLAEAVKELNTGSNQDKALFGAAAGFVVSSGSKAAITAPKAAVQLAGDATGSALTAAAKLAKKGAVKSSLKILSEEDRENVARQYKVKKESFDAIKAKKDKQVSDLDSFSTIDSVTDKEILIDIMKVKAKRNFTTAEMKDPELFNAVKNEVKRAYNSTTIQAKAGLEASRVGVAAKLIAKNTKKGVTGLASKIATKEQVEATIANVKEYGNTAVEAAKNLQTSGALGVLEAGLAVSKHTSKESVNSIKEIAETLSFKEFKTTMAVLESKNKVAYAALKPVFKDVEKAYKSFQEISGETNKDNIASVIKSAIGAGEVISESAPLMEEAIVAAFQSRISDKEGVEALGKALDLYEKSERFKTNKSQLIQKSDIAIYRKKLKKAGSIVISAEKIDTAVNKSAEKIAGAIKNVNKSTEEKTAKEESGSKDGEKTSTITEKVTAAVNNVKDNSKVYSSLKNAGSAFGTVVSAISDKADVIPLENIEKEFALAKTETDKKAAIVKMSKEFTPVNSEDSDSVSTYAAKLFSQGKTSNKDVAEFIRENFPKTSSYKMPDGKTYGSSIGSLIVGDLEHLDKLSKENVAAESEAVDVKFKLTLEEQNIDRENNNDDIDIIELASMTDQEKDAIMDKVPGICKKP
jgi:hypothetical protein